MCSTSKFVSSVSFKIWLISIAINRNSQDKKPLTTDKSEIRMMTHFLKKSIVPFFYVLLEEWTTTKNTV